MKRSEGSAASPESIEFEFQLPHAPAKVWRALTDPALLAEWLLPAIGHRLERGAAFTFQAPPQPEWDGTVACRILEIEAERKLSWSWEAGGVDTVVTFTLEPSGAGTQLSLVQSGFRPDQKRNVSGARYGWKMMGGKLAELLDRTP